MDKLSPKSFTTSRSFTYSYYAINAKSQTGKPTLLFLHGWPDSAHLWSDVVQYLTTLDFPVLIPDLLGYGGTSKPTDTKAYNTKAMADDLAELLDAESVKDVIPIGHDWGAHLAQRFYMWHPSRCVGLVLLNVAYAPPDQKNPFNLEAVLKMTEARLGYPLYAYWELFTAPDGPEVLNSHLESLWTALHGDNRTQMRELFCTRGRMREYLTSDEMTPLRAYAQDPKWKQDFLNRFQKDGFAAPQQWYCSMTKGVQDVTDMVIPPERFYLDIPLLFIGCTQDAVCLTGFINIAKDKGLLPKLTVEELDCGHWCPMEKPEEVAQHIVAYLKAHF